MQKVWNQRTCISKRFQNCGSYQSVAHTFCGLFKTFNKGQSSARAQQGNGPVATMVGAVFRDGALQDPLLSPTGDAEWVSKAAGEVGNDGGSSQGRGGLGKHQPGASQPSQRRWIALGTVRGNNAELSGRGCCSQGQGLRYHSLRPGSDIHSE